MRPLFILLAIAGLIAILKTPSDYLEIKSDAKLLEAPAKLAAKSAPAIEQLDSRIY